MHRGIEVVLHQSLTHEDGVLVVVSLPGHVGDQYVLTQGDLPALAGGAVRQHLAGNHAIALLHDWSLIEAGVLVGALVLLQHVVMILTLLIADDDLGGVHEHHLAVHPGDRHHARVTGDLGFQAGAH